MVCYPPWPKVIYYIIGPEKSLLLQKQNLLGDESFSLVLRLFGSVKPLV